MANWISVDLFAERHGINKDSIYQRKGAKWLKKIDGAVKVDEDYWLDVWRAKSDLWNYSHDLYFKIKEYGLSDLKIAEFLARLGDGTPASWAVFMSTEMFFPVNFNLDDSPMTRHYLFCKRAEKLLKLLKRREDVSIDNRRGDRRVSDVCGA